jgi:non-specific serine/threonine protein kinase
MILGRCERVAAEAALVVNALLQDCPHLRILATSRESLPITGERTYRLESAVASGGSQTGVSVCRTPWAVAY